MGLQKVSSKLTTAWPACVDNMLTGHELHYMVACFRKNHLNLFRVTSLELLLQEAATMLILAQAVDFAFDLFKLDVREASVLCC